MDFVVGFPSIQRGSDVIWVVVDRLIKSAYFIFMRVSDSVDYFVDLYIRDVVSLYGVSVTIVSDSDFRFTVSLWQSLQSVLGIKLIFSTVYYFQTDGQSERIIQIFEDMFRGCVLDFSGTWESYLLLVEFVYNNSFQFSIGMVSFEVLYGRPCSFSVCWVEVGDVFLLGPELVSETTENVEFIRSSFVTVQSR